MSVITKITVQQKNKDRYNIFLDGQYAFSVDEDVLIKFNLKKGLELDEFTLMEIHYQDDIRKAYNRAIQYLTRKMRSEHEVRTHLLEKEVEDPVIQEVIHKLYDYKFLNDEEYALAFVRTQMNTTDKGIEVIARDLKTRGVHAAIIEKALKEYPLDRQVEKAKELWEKVMKKGSRDSERILKQKAEQHLLRKGFPFDVISLAIEQAEADKDENEEWLALTFQGEKAHRKYAKFEGFEYEQKMKQALYRKGFSLEMIEQFLRQQKDEQ